jgi:uncharacterized membrane protein
MAEKLPQTYENHRRLDPAYHFVGLAIFLANFVVALVGLIRTPGPDRAWTLVLAAGLVLAFLKVRTYALHNQDRVIRMEETLRLQRLLPEALHGRIQDLKVGQLVSLRFASDEELPDLVEQTLAESLDREAIKKRIKTWRADTFRV